MKRQVVSFVLVGCFAVRQIFLFMGSRKQLDMNTLLPFDAPSFVDPTTATRLNETTTVAPMTIPSKDAEGRIPTKSELFFFDEKQDADGHANVVKNQQMLDRITCPKIDGQQTRTGRALEACLSKNTVDAATLSSCGCLDRMIESPSQEHMAQWLCRALLHFSLEFAREDESTAPGTEEMLRVNAEETETVKSLCTMNLKPCIFSSSIPVHDQISAMKTPPSLTTQMRDEEPTLVVMVALQEGLGE
jgi:hypothetical protein